MRDTTTQGSKASLKREKKNRAEIKANKELAASLIERIQDANNSQRLWFSSTLQLRLPEYKLTTLKQIGELLARFQQDYADVDGMWMEMDCDLTYYGMCGIVHRESFPENNREFRKSVGHEVIYRRHEKRIDACAVVPGYERLEYSILDHKSEWLTPGEVSIFQSARDRVRVTHD